ncbi:MAG TPA: L,D-transpeptidase [Hyphomicrobium sp.]|nr:L,D-transpeptidase [Hyphomicrobium sp.]HRQ26622.1 L,D-transpeptidase [Hyphomicrobium sp.]
MQRFVFGIGVAVRRLMLLAAMATLSGCATLDGPVGIDLEAAQADMYGPLPEERFPIPATRIANVDPKYLRTQVAYETAEHPGTIVVDTSNRFLYLVQDGGTAMRYGIGVGQAGLELEGSAIVARKAEWPRWTPTQDMIRRNPEINAQWAGGMEPGLTNPLGARALYLHRDGRDTLFRIHGTSEPRSIGKAISSGCIRLFNQDIVDLYRRVPVGTKVVVLQNVAVSDNSSASQSGQPL